jgi:hypothetical protein
MQLKSYLANLTTENDALKWRISTMQAENQSLRTPSRDVLPEEGSQAVQPNGESEAPPPASA